MWRISCVLNVCFATTIQPDTPPPFNTSNTRFRYNSFHGLGFVAGKWEKMRKWGQRKWGQYTIFDIEKMGTVYYF